MDPIFYIFIFLFGLIIGSFLNCLIYRLEVGQGFLGGRSYCPNCKHTLSWKDLIPVLSFFWLRGRCRYCQGKISWQYPLVEMAIGLLFFLIADYQLPVISYFIIPFLVVIFVYDLKHYIIPDRVIYPVIGLVLVCDLFWSDFSWGLNFFISAFGAGSFFLLIVLLSRGKWMGVGDVKLAFLMGLILGFPGILPALFLAFFLGAIIGVGLIIFSKKTMKSEVPFGPFLVLGTLISLFWGQEIINWYLTNLIYG